MSPEQDDDRVEEAQDEAWEEEPPRSIFTKLWFRAVLVVVILGGVAAIAVPYVLDSMSPPPPPVAARPPAPPAPAAQPAPPAAQPAAPAAQAPAPTPATPASPTPPVAVAPTTPAPAPAPPSPAATKKPETPAPVAPAPPSPAAAKKAEPTAPALPPAAKKPETPAATAAEKKPEPATVASAPTAPAKEARLARNARRRPATGETAATGEFWVQVGAFRDPDTAKRVAQKLREQNYRVLESTTARTSAAVRPAPAETPSGDRYDVFVSGPSPADVTSKLAAKGLSSEAAEGGAVVRPSLSLREAVTLSRDLASEGFKVQVKRASGGATAPAPSAPPAAPAGDTLHRVRVGGLPDRATAVETQKKLEAQGYAGFVGHGER